MKKIVLRLAFLCMMSLFALGVSATPDKDYLCFTANEDGSTVELKKNLKPTSVTLEYSIDDGANWTTVNFSSATTTGAIALTKKGEKVYFRNQKEAKDVTGFSIDRKRN